jgi:hypothetical protein
MMRRISRPPRPIDGTRPRHPMVASIVLIIAVLVLIVFAVASGS